MHPPDMIASLTRRIALPELAGPFAPEIKRAVWPLRLVKALVRAWPALLPALLFLPVVLSPPLNHDVAAVLDFSQRWLAGERLYTDLIDVNPPLIFVLTCIPAWIASVTPVGKVAALQGSVLVYGVACWALALRARDRRRKAPVKRAFLDVLPGLFLLAAGYDFGQREHLMAVGALPYLLSAARRAEGDRRPPARVAVALVAAVGFALKPHFLAIPALVEAAVVVGRASRRPFPRRLLDGMGASLRDPVPWAMAAVWLSYLATLPVLFPEYLRSVVPLIWDYYLANGGLTVGAMLLVPRMATALCLLLPALALTARLRGREVALPRVLALAALGALASALAQHKGWSYHIVPIELFAGALAAVLAARWLDGLGAARWHRSGYPVASALAGLMALYAVSNGEAPWRELDYRGGQVNGLERLLQPGAAGEPMLVLSPGIYPIYPALTYLGARQTLRAMNTWLLQGAYRECLPNGRRYREMSEMGQPELVAFRTVVEDFARAPPAVVVVDKQPGIPWCGSEFDFIAYYKRDPLFAQVWSRYRQTAEWDRYRVYTRAN